ncbi:MAG: hypothetical protein FJW34_11290 [Acidobacteria bacterium]|nr:hypothetical protein [Acidobacteriota bacterium]
MKTASDLLAFARLITALDPWLDRIVIIGGWAHRLYRLHPRAQMLDYAPLTTLDTDIAVPAVLPVRERDIRDRLRAAGFVEEFFGDDQPPATHYRLGAEEGSFYVEFLAPLVGGEYDGRNKRTVTAQVGGVTVQRLRHISLLLDDPWEVDLDLAGVADGRRTVRIAHPARFLAQKVLIHAKRSRSNRAKDILYMHDTLEVFGLRLAELRAEWEATIAPQLHRRDSAKVRKASGTLFGEVTDDIRVAVTMAAGRSLTPESVREACQFGFEQVFT